MVAGTQHIKNASQKLGYLRDRLDGVEKPDANSWKQGVSGIDEFILAYETVMFPKTPAKGSLRTDLSKCNNAYGEISGPKFKRMLLAFGLELEDSHWFKDSNLETFKANFARRNIRIPKPRLPAESGALKLVPLSQKDFLGTDHMSFHVMPNTQGSQMEPFLDIFANAMFCAEHDCHYGFTKLMVFFEFIGGPTIRLDELLGDRGIPYETRQLRLTAKNPMKPRLTLELIGEDGAPIFDEDYFIQDPLGRIMEAHAGDEIRISLRAHRKDDVIRYADRDRPSDPALEEIENIIFSNEALKHTPEMNVSTAVSPSEYVTLSEQTIEIQHDTKI